MAHEKDWRFVMLLGARQFFERRGAPTPPLPYDAEVEYLESTGTQYVNTGMYANLDTVAHVRAMPMAYSGLQWLLGARSSYDRNAFVIYNGSDQSFKYTFNYDNVKITNAHLVSDISSDSAVWRDIIIGRTASIESWSAEYRNAGSFTTAYPVLLFACNAGGSIQYGSYRVSSCSLYQDGVLVQDLIPVRKNGVGYMYDKVSGTLFGNSGTGAFLYGNDI